MSEGRLTYHLARLRIPLGFLCGVAVLWLAAPTSRTVMTGGVVAFAGEALRIWAAGHLNKAREVTRSGPYRWLAHPLYTGSSVMGLGLAIASGRAIVAVLIATYLVLTMTAAVRSEETLLRQRFGDAYDRYRATAGRGVVGPRARTGDERRRFRVTQAIANGEHRTIVGLAVAILLLLLKATYNGTFWQPGG